MSIRFLQPWPDALPSSPGKMAAEVSAVVTALENRRPLFAALAKRGQQDALYRFARGEVVNVMYEARQLARLFEVEEEEVV
ncbi:MAG: hypothetical protein KJZ92_14280 [Rhodocyclaceae bacterium]|nr:hypothetical protein [Rhodocyclaceae bacterium]